MAEDRNQFRKRTVNETESEILNDCKDFTKKIKYNVAENHKDKSNNQMFQDPTKNLDDEITQGTELTKCKQYVGHSACSYVKKDAELLTTLNSFEHESSDITETKAVSGNDIKEELKGKVGLREADVGITEYISSYKGFFAVLKERYSDFVVHEITPDGTIVKLTNMKKPEEPVTATQISDVISYEDLRLLEKLCNNQGEMECVIIQVSDKNKDERRKIHEAVRQYIPGLESSTENRDGSKIIVVKKLNTKGDFNAKVGTDSDLWGGVIGPFGIGICNGQCPPTGRSCRKTWPTTRGNYTHFVLYKENKDTMDAINTISSKLRLLPKTFSYAGTKDKRAKTSQLVSAYRLLASDLLSFNNKSKQIKVGNVEYKKMPIKLGDLSGNSFTIILRKSTGSTEEIERAVLSLSENGFINYFGMQRFGTTSVATHYVGRTLLQGNWKEAIDMILKPRNEAEDRNLTASRKIWWETKDASRAYSNLMNKGSIEGRLLSGIIAHGPKDFINALNAIPRNTRLIYLHSYQSYIWNKVVSSRISKYGLRVLNGDLILPASKNTEIHESFSEDQDIPMPENSSPRYITEDELSLGTTIYDVVLPLPGHCVIYPQNETTEWYKEYLKNDGMDFNSFYSKIKSYSLGGSYRKIFVKPSGVKWEIIKYDDSCEPLVFSDLEILQGIEKPIMSKVGGLHNALRLEFSLPSSSYATMAVREILKVDTSVTAQKASSAL